MNWIKELIISLLVCLLVLIGLSFLFYNFIPNNKVIPEKIEYKASDEIKKELNSEVDNSSDKIIKTYEITASDLEQYQKNNEYNPGKKNPFAPISQESTEDNTTDSDGTNSGGSSNGGSSNNTSNYGGSLFEPAGTK